MAEEWFQRWWDEDYSWAGLAQKPWPEGPEENLTLRDYWRTVDPQIESKLLYCGERNDESIMWTPYHLPMHDLAGNFSEKAMWKNERQQEINTALVSLAQISGRETVNPARLDGVVFSGEVSFQSLDLHANFSDVTFGSYVNFAEATFTDYTDFSNTMFKSIANFSNATFKGYAQFRNAVFKWGVNFEDVTFRSDANFGNAIFEGKVNFISTKFDGYGNEGLTYFSDKSKGYANFREAMFTDNADFSETTFKGLAEFSKVTFMSDANFRNVTFTSNVKFSEAMFKGLADFAGIKGTHRFSEAIFVNACFMSLANFSGRAFYGFTDFSNARFYGVPQFYDCHMRADTRFRNTHFEGGVCVASVMRLENAKRADRLDKFNKKRQPIKPRLISDVAIVSTMPLQCTISRFIGFVLAVALINNFEFGKGVFKYKTL